MSFAAYMVDHFPNIFGTQQVIYMLSAKEAIRHADAKICPDCRAKDKRTTCNTCSYPGNCALCMISAFPPHNPELGINKCIVCTEQCNKSTLNAHAPEFKPTGSRFGSAVTPNVVQSPAVKDPGARKSGHIGIDFDEIQRLLQNGPDTKKKKPGLKQPTNCLLTPDLRWYPAMDRYEYSDSNANSGYQPK